MTPEIAMSAIEEAIAILQTKKQEIQNGQVQHPVRWNAVLLREELVQRVADEYFLEEQAPSSQTVVIAAVDGSTRSGMMSFVGEEQDFYVGHAPMISINTSIGEVNRRLRMDGEEYPVFLRLPEKPEDVQQRDNKYTVMAKLFYPDLSDAEYMHSLWNAMDVLEAKATLRMLSRWTTSHAGVEIPAADLVLCDGTIVPQDRDFAHYRDLNRYGEIVRDLVETNWKIITKCQTDSQTVAGAVKNAQLRVFGPVLNWCVKELCADKKAGPLEAWPIQALNLLPDQVLISRLLTAERKEGDPWVHTCVVLRPFHATTNFAKGYSRANPPERIIEKKRTDDLANHATGEYVENVGFWQQLYRGNSDAYVQMLGNVWYANFFVASVPRLDFDRFLPRIEYVVPCKTQSTRCDPIAISGEHMIRVLSSLSQTGFEVSAEHSMFKDKSMIEVLPELVVRAHDTVKIWARELMARVDEYLAVLLSSHIASKRSRGIRVRPFTKQELKMLHDSLYSERRRMGGSTAAGSLGS